MFISHAQNFEDVMLWRALRDVREGFWIDVGAAEPDLLSVTQAFSERGWRGINIEPAARPFALLQEGRPNDLNLCVALGASNGEATLFEVDDANGLTTTDARLAAEHSQSGFRIGKVVVPVRTLAEICAEHVHGEVHFLKVDVEGCEQAVLAGADFERCRPWIVLVESTAPNRPMEVHETWEPILLAAGYWFAWFDGLNRFYVADEHRGLLAHFRVPPNVFDGFVRAEEVLARRRAAAAEDRAGVAAEEMSAAEVATQAARAETMRAHAATYIARGETAVARAEIGFMQAEIVAVRDEADSAAKAQRAGVAAMAVAHSEAIKVMAGRISSIEADAAEAAASALAECGRLEMRADASEAELARMRDSRSWRMTRPIRGLARRGRILLGRQR